LDQDYPRVHEQTHYENETIIDRKWKLN